MLKRVLLVFLKIKTNDKIMLIQI